MKFEIVTSSNFARELKRLAKKHSSIKQDVYELGESFAITPEQGIYLGKDCYKIKLAIKSKGRGKSGGARVITCVISVQEQVLLLSIYDKSEKSSISDKELSDLLQEFGLQ
jgi:mRNA-degrading endonuclease RelE of RelBE toxin-antitoxin system